MKRIGIIGLGHNAKYYKDGFYNSCMLDLVAVCDKDKSSPSFLSFKSYEFYTDYLKMISIEMLDYVLIATEPFKHYEIAKKCLEKGVNVIIEAPVGMSYDETTYLINYAKKNALLFDVINHTENYSEVSYIKEHINEYGTLKDIYITVNYPFSKNGKNIDKEYVNLDGCYYYDAYEIFDLLSNFLPLKKIILMDKNIKKDSSTNDDIYVCLDLYIDGVNVHIIFDWTNNSTLINSKFVFSKNIVNICHSSQIITINVREQVNCKTKKEKYTEYYEKYLSNYIGKVSYDHILNIHKIMFTMKDL